MRLRPDQGRPNTCAHPRRASGHLLVRGTSVWTSLFEALNDLAPKTSRSSGQA
jgi:hypothetical protein